MICVWLQIDLGNNKVSRGKLVRVHILINKLVLPTCLIRKDVLCKHVPPDNDMFLTRYRSQVYFRVSRVVEMFLAAHPVHTAVSYWSMSCLFNCYDYFNWLNSSLFDIWAAVLAFPFANQAKGQLQGAVDLMQQHTEFHYDCNRFYVTFTLSWTAFKVI